nr:unnamed protein product [Callosobruchus analis]
MRGVATCVTIAVGLALCLAVAVPGHVVQVDLDDALKYHHAGVEGEETLGADGDDWWKNAKAVAKSKVMFKNKAKQSWSNFCSSLNAHSNPSRIWRKVNAISKGITSKWTNSMSDNDAEIFCKKLAPDSADECVSDINTADDHFLTSSISVEELDISIKAQDSAPGRDESPQHNNALFRNIIDRYKPVCEIYTDGSKSTDGVGCACWIPSLNFQKITRCSDKSSIYTAEAIAIDNALDFILSYTESMYHRYIIISDSLSDLGITGAWLSPIFKSPDIDQGYDISDYKNVDDLLEEAKKIGFKIILDFVPNHTSDQHEWFTESVKSTETYKDFYFAEQQPDLNYRNDKVKQAMLDIMDYWLDMGVDGFRVDAVPYLVEDKDLRDEPVAEGSHYNENDADCLQRIYTKDTDDTYSILYDIRKHVDEYAKNKGVSTKVLMSEAYSDINHTMKYYGSSDGTQLGAHFTFNFQLLGMIKDENFKVADIVNAINICNADAFNMLTAFLPGIMVTYNGEEIGMTDGQVTCKRGQDPQAKKDCSTFNETSRDFERTPMQWDDSTNAGFSTAESDKKEHLQKASKKDDLRVDGASNNVFRAQRIRDDTTYTLLFNIADAAQEVKLSSQHLLLTSQPTKSKHKVGDVLDSITLQPHESVIVKSAAGIQMAASLFLVALYKIGASFPDVEHLTFSEKAPRTLASPTINFDSTKYKKATTPNETIKQQFLNSVEAYQPCTIIYTDGSKTSGGVDCAMLFKPTIKKWSPPPLTRQKQVVLTRLRIGHTFLTHSHLLLGNQPETCRGCEVLLTWNHIFLECPLYMVARTLFNLPDSIKDCLLSSSSIRTTLSFLKAIKLFRKL